MVPWLKFPLNWGRALILAASGSGAGETVRL